MADLSDLTALKKQVDDLQRTADRASGALEQAMSRLKDEFGCASLKDAKVLLKGLQTQETETKEAFDGAFSAFEEEWEDDLTD